MSIFLLWFVALSCCFFWNSVHSAEYVTTTTSVTTTKYREPDHGRVYEVYHLWHLHDLLSNQYVGYRAPAVLAIYDESNTKCNQQTLLGSLKFSPGYYHAWLKEHNLKDLDLNSLMFARFDRSTFRTRIWHESPPAIHELFLGHLMGDESMIVDHYCISLIFISSKYSEEIGDYYGNSVDSANLINDGYIEIFEQTSQQSWQQWLFDKVMDDLNEKTETIEMTVDDNGDLIPMVALQREMNVKNSIEGGIDSEQYRIPHIVNATALAEKMRETCVLHTNILIIPMHAKQERLLLSGSHGWIQRKIPENLMFHLQSMWNRNESSNEGGRTVEWHDIGHSDNAPNGVYFTRVKDFIPHIPGVEFNTDDLKKGRVLGMDTDRMTVIEHVKTLIAQWIGLSRQDIEFRAAYGFREYKRGSVLRNHVDRLDSHALSAIINLEQTHPWALEIRSMIDGQRYQINIEPSQIVLYEGNMVVHGRPEPFEGDSFVNLFMHFKHKDRFLTMSDILRSQDSFLRNELHLNTAYLKWLFALQISIESG